MIPVISDYFFGKRLVKRVSHKRQCVLNCHKTIYGFITFAAAFWFKTVAKISNLFKFNKLFLFYCYAYSDTCGRLPAKRAAASRNSDFCGFSIGGIRDRAAG